MRVDVPSLLVLIIVEALVLGSSPKGALSRWNEKIIANFQYFGNNYDLEITFFSLSVTYVYWTLVVLSKASTRTGLANAI